MKRTITKLLGGALVALFLMPGSAQATITAKWDWTTDNPSGITSTALISNSTATITSSNGVDLFVDATASGATLRSQSGNAQFNAGTKLRVPVVSTNDVVTFVAHSYTYAGVKIGNEDFDAGDPVVLTRTHQATNDEVQMGYVVIESKGGYLTTVSVELAYMPLSFSTLISVVNWDWENNIPDEIRTFAGIEGGTGTINSDVSGYVLGVDATTGKLGPNGATPQFTSGTKLKVPVTNVTDVVTIKRYGSSGDGKKIVIRGTDYTSLVTTYIATEEDVTQGYVEITSGCDYLYSVKLQKSNLTTTTIGSTAWATFSNAQATDFTNLVGVVDAYQVTGNTGSTITKEAVATADAGTGLLLNAEAGTYAIPLATTGADLSGTNKLKALTAGGTIEAAAGDFTNFVLVGGTGTASFKKVTGTNSAIVGAGKAYLQLAGTAFAPQLFFGDDVTAIHAVKSSAVENGTYFNLAGQRVENPTQGLYIVNGKKVVVK